MRPFDAKADGTVFGDSVAALVLRRHEAAGFGEIHQLTEVFLPAGKMGGGWEREMKVRFGKMVLEPEKWFVFFFGGGEGV